MCIEERIYLLQKNSYYNVTSNCTHQCTRVKFANNLGFSKMPSVIFFIISRTNLYNFRRCVNSGDRNSAVRTVTVYGLDGSGFEPRWGTIFSVLVYTGTEDDPASCKIGTGYFSRG
jgi:hypothetical protein